MPLRSGAGFQRVILCQNVLLSVYIPLENTVQGSPSLTHATSRRPFSVTVCHGLWRTVISWEWTPSLLGQNRCHKKYIMACNLSLYLFRNSANHSSQTSSNTVQDRQDLAQTGNGSKTKRGFPPIGKSPKTERCTCQKVRLYESPLRIF